MERERAEPEYRNIALKTLDISDQQSLTVLSSGKMLLDWFPRLEMMARRRSSEPIDITHAVSFKLKDNLGSRPGIP